MVMNVLRYSIVTAALVIVAYTGVNFQNKKIAKHRMISQVTAPAKDSLIQDRLVSFAETLTGTPYRYGSSRKENGFDCSGFITYVFSHFGFHVPRSSVEFTHVGREVSINEARRGDLILFTGTDPQQRIVGHMGIIVSNADSLRFIHSTSGKEYGVTITPLSEHYRKRFMKVTRVFDEQGRLVL
jgi:cell wall-associated NlpC family hydrolase